MKRGAIVVLVSIGCAHDHPIVRAPAPNDRPTTTATTPTTVVTTSTLHTLHTRDLFASYSPSNWRCGTAELPGQITFDHATDERVIDPPPIHRTVQSYPSLRALNDELERTIAPIHDCYVRADAAHLAVPQMSFTIEEQPHPPVLIKSVTPREAPLGLTVCVADVFRRELVGPFGSEGPVTITTDATSLP